MAPLLPSSACPGAAGGSLLPAHSIEPATPLFALDLDRTAQLTPQRSGSVQSSTSHCWLRSRARALTEPRTSFEERVLRDVRFFKSAVQREEGANDTVVLASKLVSVGYAVSIRTAVGGGTGQDCFQHLHHTFLLVSPGARGGDDAHSRLIVDPSFRSSFELSDMHSNSLYAAALPPSEEFVGGEARVSQLVAFLCGEMAEAFRAAGHTCPPWRTQRSMLSKWLPARARDTVVCPTVCGDKRKAPGSRSSFGSAAEAPAPVAADSIHACGSSGSPSSPLDMAISPSALHAAIARATALPLHSSRAAAAALQMSFSVQTGFSVAPGTSMLSRELGLQQAAAQGDSSGGSLQRPAALAPFDMWPQQLRDGSTGSIEAPAWPRDGVGAIRTVKMTGQRCR